MYQIMWLGQSKLVKVGFVETLPSSGYSYEAQELLEAK